MGLTIRNDLEILIESGLTKIEASKMKYGIDYIIYDKCDFVENFREYTDKCDIEDIKYLLNLLFGITATGNNKYARVDYPDGECYIIQFV